MPPQDAKNPPRVSARAGFSKLGARWNGRFLQRSERIIPPQGRPEQGRVATKEGWDVEILNEAWREALSRAWARSTKVIGASPQARVSRVGLPACVAGLAYLRSEDTEAGYRLVIILSSAVGGLVLWYAILLGYNLIRARAEVDSDATIDELRGQHWAELKAVREEHSSEVECLRHGHESGLAAQSEKLRQKHKTEIADMQSRVQEVGHHADRARRAAAGLLHLALYDRPRDFGLHDIAIPLEMKYGEQTKFQFAYDCWLFLRAMGFKGGQDAARKLLDDEELRATLSDLLKKPSHMVDPLDVCTWGAWLSMAPHLEWPEIEHRMEKVVQGVHG